MTPFDEFFSNLKKEEQEQRDAVNKMQNDAREKAENQSKKALQIFKNLIGSTMKKMEDSAKQQEDYSFVQKSVNSSYPMNKYLLTLRNTPIEIEFRYVGGPNIECDMKSRIKGSTTKPVFFISLENPLNETDLEKMLEDGITRILTNRG